MVLKFLKKGNSLYPCIIILYNLVPEKGPVPLPKRVLLSPFGL